MSFNLKLVLCFSVVIFVNATVNETTSNAKDDVALPVPIPPESNEPEQLPKQEPFTWLLPSFIRNNLPFMSPEEESEPHPQERRRFDQDIERRKHHYLRIPKNPEVNRRKYDEDIGMTLSRKHPGRVPSSRPREGSYQRYRPNIRQRIPEGDDDNDVQESSVNVVGLDKGNNAHGSLQAALKSLWEHKKKTYRNLLAKSEAYEKLAGAIDESKWHIDSSSSEWPQELPSESQADRRNFMDPQMGVLLNGETINEFARAPDIISDELQRLPPPLRNLEEISEIPQRNPNLRRLPENLQEYPPRIKPSRRIPENPRRIRISNPRRPPNSPEDPSRTPPSKRRPPFIRRERFPEDIPSNQRETYSSPPRRRTPLPNRESIARNSNINIDYPDDYINDQSRISKTESSGRWPRSMQLVRPRDPKPTTDDHKNHLDDDSYFYDLTIIDDEGLDKLNEAYTYVAPEEEYVSNQDSSGKSPAPIYDFKQASDDDISVDGHRMVDDGDIRIDDYYAVTVDDPSQIVRGIPGSNDEFEEIEYVDMYEDDFRKLIEENSSDYELEEVIIPEYPSIDDSDFYHRQGSVRIPGSVSPQSQKTIRMKINPGKNSGTKVIKMKIRGLEDGKLEKPIGENQLPKQSLQQTPNDNRQFNQKQESLKKTSSKAQVVKTSKAKYPSPVTSVMTPRPPVNIGTTPKPKGYPHPPGYSGSNYMPPGGGKKPNFFDFGKPKPGKKRPGGTYSGGKKPTFSGYGGIKPGGGSMYPGGGFNEAGIKNALTSTFHQASGVIPDLSKAITVMSFLAFSVFVANLGVNALANSSLGISIGRESGSPWSLTNSPFKIEDMIHNLDQLLKGSKDDSKTAADSFDAVVDIAENVYNELHENIRIEVGNLSEKINNYLDNNFAEDGLPLGDISKKYLLIEDENSKNDLNINCYRRLLCLSHQLTLKLNISDSRNKMLPFWTFGIGWLKGGQEHVATLLENLRAELAGQSGRNCYSLYSDCENSLAVENYVKETEIQLKNLTKEDTKWEPISSSTEKKEQSLNDSGQQNLRMNNNNYEDKNNDKFKVVHKSTVARVTVQKNNK